MVITISATATTKGGHGMLFRGPEVGEERFFPKFFGHPVLVDEAVCAICQPSWLLG